LQFSHYGFQHQKFQKTINKKSKKSNAHHKISQVFEHKSVDYIQARAITCDKTKTSKSHELASGQICLYTAQDDDAKAIEMPRLTFYCATMETRHATPITVYLYVTFTTVF